MPRRTDNSPGARKDDATQHSASRSRWRLDGGILVIVLMMFLGVGLVLYPSTAAWVSQYNQSRIVNNYAEEVPEADPPSAEQLKLAREYNAKLRSGLLLESGANKPSSEGAQSGEGEASDSDYENLLSVNSSGMMGRIRIASIDVDLPIYHGTSDETLQSGVGHLKGTSLPVGGEGTRSVLTAHRGLSSATLFTNLDKVTEGDRIVLEILDEVLTYEVIDYEVVDPDETQKLAAVEGKDLLTLVTCTPLGINSQRILVTAERVIPTPTADIEAQGQESDLPRFPWWAVGILGALAAGGVVLWRTGVKKAQAYNARAAGGAGNSR